MEPNAQNPNVIQPSPAGYPPAGLNTPQANAVPPTSPAFAAPPVPAATLPGAAQQAQPLQPKPNANSTQNTLQISEIRDGVVIMNDGSFRSVIMCKSINFDLMSGQEREGVEYAYQGFLNSLYFPIQIFVRSQKVDLRPYIEKLDKIRTEHDNMLLALLMEDYIVFMEQLATQTNIMDKKFYIVIPFYPGLDTSGGAVKASKSFVSKILGDFAKKNKQQVVINEADLEKAKTELRNRVQAAMSGLIQCGVQALPLDTQELIELYYDAYNPDTATRQQLKDFNQLAAPVVTKGVGTAPNPNLERELQ
jgi:hypothetical protein